MPELGQALAQSWVDRWDAQQQGYMPDREERFTALIDAVADGAGRPDPLRRRRRRHEVAAAMPAHDRLVLDLLRAERTLLHSSLRQCGAPSSTEPGDDAIRRGSMRPS